MPRSTRTPTHLQLSILPLRVILASPENKSDSALAVFTNENPASEANFAIYFSQGKPIPPSVLSVPDSQILAAAIPKLFDTSKFTVYQKNIERFSDGFVIEAVASQNQTGKNSPIIEEFFILA